MTTHTDENDQQRVANGRRVEKWHVGREIPLALIAVVILQTSGFIWKFSELSAKLDNTVAILAEFKSERYTRDDARRDRELIEQKLTAIREAETQITHDLDRRLGAVEGRTDRLERK